MRMIQQAMMRAALAIVVMAIMILASAVDTRADWRGFRGGLRGGVADGTVPPTSWAEGNEGENIVWKTAIEGRGVSGPIVVGDAVYVTSSSGYRRDRLHVVSLDATSGDVRWQRQFWATGRTFCHPTSAVAAPTPVSDGEAVYAFFSSNDLVCLELSGDLRWYRGLTHDFPKAGNDVGMSSSPVIVDDVVVVQVETKATSFAAGIDTATGKTRWQIDRPQSSNWCSPTVVEHGGQTVVMLQSSMGLSAHDPQTGAQLWSFDEPCSTIPSVASSPELVLVAAEGITALTRDGQSNAADVVWRERRLSPGSSSPLVYRDRVYALSRAGILNTGVLATGEHLGSLRLKGPFWATPVAAGDFLFFFNQDGLAQVVDIGGDEAEIMSQIEMGESVMGSPAIDDGQLYVRSISSVWKIAAP
jgi:outer membrane protein assembly factor BamB